MRRRLNEELREIGVAMDDPELNELWFAVIALLFYVGLILK